MAKNNKDQFGDGIISLELEDVIKEHMKDLVFKRAYEEERARIDKRKNRK